MKLNLDYYKKELDTKEIPEEIFEKIINYEGDDFSKIIDKNSNIKEILALSDIRENILNWYEFKENATILEMSANYGELTGLLCEKSKKVISIESSKKCASIIEKRHKNTENLELIVGDFTKIELTEKFDYIVITGIVNNLENVLEYSNRHLKEDGIILLLVNNRFGVRAWITTKDEEKITNNKDIAISKENIEKLLQNMQYKYYYPLPDYKLPNIIYTEKCMPTLTNIYRDLTYKDGNVNFKEIDAYYEIIKNNPEDFKKFANSFLIEISNKSIEENDIKFIAFSNMRKDEYRIKTIVTEKEVYKSNINSKSKKHIEKIKKNIEILQELGISILDTYNKGQIISKYVENQTLEDKLIDIYQKQGKEEFFKEIEQYKQFLKEKLKVTQQIEKNIFTKYKVSCENLEALTFVEHGFWDLIFQNCFIIDNEYNFYDQEWYEENVPIEYILYRAILYFNESKKYITDEEIFDYLGIKQYISIFKELDDKIQEKTRKQIVWNMHTKEELEKNKYTKLKKEFKQKEIENLELKNEIERLKAENEQKCNEINFITNSLSWKITEPLRKIRGHGKK